MEILLALLVALGLGALISGGSDNDPDTPSPDETIDDDDPAVGTDGDDTVVLTGGPDLYDGGAGNDSIDGLAGFDTIAGGTGNDIIEGGLGKDDLFGGADKDRMAGGDGNDFLEGNGGNDRLFGNDGNDILLGGDNAQGTQEFLYGGDGNDLIIGGAGADYAYGGSGNDILIGSDVVTLSPEALALQRGDIATSSQPIITIEEERGVDPAADTIYGGDGEDLILLGGSDVAEGGNGDDLFVVGVDWVGAEHVRINDFTPDEDVIVIGYDADDGPPVIRYEQASNGQVDVNAIQKCHWMRKAEMSSRALTVAQPDRA
jgi:Ca2+-binding RTX toxin-like protein